MGLQIPAGSTLQLTVQMRAATEAQPVRCNGFIRADNGTIYPFTLDIAAADITNDYTSSSATVTSIGPGELLWAAIRIGPGNSQKYGRVWVRLRLVNGDKAIDVIADYLTGTYEPSYPTGVVKSPRERPGQLRVITTANPAAGAEVAATAVPANVRWRLLSFTVSMAQGITQTPRPALLIRNAAAATIVLIPLSADVAASTTVQCTWARGLDTAANNVDTGSMSAPAPDMDLREAMDVSTSTQGIGANSDYGAAILVVEEWLDVGATAE